MGAIPMTLATLCVEKKRLTLLEDVLVRAFFASAWRRRLADRFALPDYGCLRCCATRRHCATLLLLPRSESVADRFGTTFIHRSVDASDAQSGPVGPPRVVCCARCD